MKRSNNAFLKRQKELLRQQKKQEKKDRLVAQRNQRGSLDEMVADAKDLEALGLGDRALPPGGEEPGTPSS